MVELVKKYENLIEKCALMVEWNQVFNFIICNSFYVAIIHWVFGFVLEMCYEICCSLFSLFYFLFFGRGILLLLHVWTHIASHHTSLTEQVNATPSRGVQYLSRVRVWIFNHETEINVHRSEKGEMNMIYTEYKVIV